jgi:hypothetical protein
MSHGLEHHPHACEIVPKGQRDLILQELELILESPLFRSSKRCQQFLRYSVQHVLDGELHHLKERLIGIAVFERPTSYNTGEDSIVRVTAKEVRSRLTQYYAGLGVEPPVRLEIAPGSYKTEFHWSDAAGHAAPVAAPTAPPTATPPEESHNPPRGFLWWPFALGSALLALVCSAVAYSALFPAKPDLLTRFWGPVLESSKPILICLANPGVYRLDDEVFQRFGIDDPGHATVVAAHLPDQGTVYGREIIPVPNGYAGMGDTIAVAHLAVLFTKFGKSLQLRKSTDISFSDLRSAPAVLIGAFTNSWTLEMMNEWRFAFDINGTAGWVIRDRKDPARVWANPALRQELRNRKVTEDYALISRVFEERSGQPVISVAGITDFGTEAAAEFLSDESLLAVAFSGAPKQWERKNLQLVIRTEVVGHTTGRPQFVARQIW